MNLQSGMKARVDFEKTNEPRDPVSHSSKQRDIEEKQYHCCSIIYNIWELKNISMLPM